jgi:predicted YcjX-like family ATPase
MKRLKTELNALVNRGVDRHLRLAVTGLSRSGKTAFITALVNQLLNIHTGARLPLLSARAKSDCLASSACRSGISAFRDSPTTKGWPSCTASRPCGQPRRAG